MRDLVITLIVFGSLPLTLKRPYIGVLMWVWLSVMNPHRLSWGFAYDFPFAAIVAAVTLCGLLIAKGPKKLPMTPVVATFLCFTVWMLLTTAAAIHPGTSWEMLQRTLKIVLMTCVGIALVNDKQKLHYLIWTLCASLGYYGIKGGVFTISSGGDYRIWGPEGTFIAGNNEVALAFITIIPVFYYLFLNSSNKWLRYAFAAAMLLLGLSALASYSRGALVGIVAMAAFLWLKSPKKIVLGLLMAIVIPAAIAFMPAQWSQRMDTIKEYEADDSAMGRINAWSMAFNLAKDRPLGGGLDIYDSQTFARYAPNPTDVHAAHSIYFQAMGEHGFIGLALYLLLGLLSWRTGTRIIRNAGRRPDLKWAATLATMLQVSMVGFGVGGAFLSLLYFDVPYYLMAIMVITDEIVRNTLRAEAEAARQRPASDAAAAGLLPAAVN